MVQGQHLDKGPCDSKDRDAINQVTSVNVHWNTLALLCGEGRTDRVSVAGITEAVGVRGNTALLGRAHWLNALDVFIAMSATCMNPMSVGVIGGVCDCYHGILSDHCHIAAGSHLQVFP